MDTRNTRASAIAALELRGAVVDLSRAVPGPTGRRIRFARVRVPAGS